MSIAKQLKMFSFFVLVAVVTIGYSFASTPKQNDTYKLYQEGKAKSAKMVEESRRGEVYLSIDLLKEYGMTVDSTMTTATVKEKNGRTTKLSSVSVLADRDGKKTSVHTVKMNGVQVPSGLQPYRQSDHYMIPAESFKQLFGKAVTVKRNAGVVSVYVGKVAEPKPEVKPPAKPGTTVKPDAKYPLPSGYKPQQITSKWVDNKDRNLANMANNLGSLAQHNKDAGSLEFNADGHFYGGVADISVHSHNVNNMIPYDANVSINRWGQSTVHRDNSIPYALKEILKLYLGEKDGQWAYNIMEKRAVTGKIDGNFHKQIKVGNRYVQFQDTSIRIGKPNKKYDKYWSTEIK